jgi:hypothetical protein
LENCATTARPQFAKCSEAGAIGALILPSTRTGAARDRVFSTAADDQIGAAATGDNIPAATAVDRVRAVAALDRVEVTAISSLLDELKQLARSRRIILQRSNMISKAPA